MLDSSQKYAILVAVQSSNRDEIWLDSGCVAVIPATGDTSLKLTGELAQSKD